MALGPLHQREVHAVGQERVRGVDAQRHVERAGFVGRVVERVGDPASVGLRAFQLDRAGDVDGLSADDLPRDDHLHADVSLAKENHHS